MSKPTLATMLHPSRANLLRASKQTPGGGVTTFVGWERLRTLLVNSNEVRAFETITAIVIEDAGITLYLQYTRNASDR